MNPIDDQLDRLFRAGGGSNRSLTAPFGMETRVLAAWREARLGGGLWNPALLLRGLFAACALMVLSIWPLARTAASVNPVSDYLQLADSTVQTTEQP